VVSWFPTLDTTRPPESAATLTVILRMAHRTLKISQGDISCRRAYFGTMRRGQRSSSPSDIANYLEAGIGHGRARCFITGIIVKLAAVPMLFWLLSLADKLPSLVIASSSQSSDMCCLRRIHEQFSGHF